MSAYREFKKRTINYLLIVSVSLGTTSIYSGFLSFDKQPEELLELSPKKKSCSLQIQHEVPGSIDIQGWHQNHIAVSIQKYTHTDDDADRITVTLTQTEYGVITLAILENEALQKKVQVDITVHIPHHIATTITAQNN